MCDVKGQGHKIYPISNRCTSYLFYITRTNHTIPEIWPKECLTLKKHNRIFRQIRPNTISNRTSSISNQTICMAMGIAATFCSEWMSGSHFNVQTSKFNLTNATSVTLGQGHSIRSSSTFPQTYIFFVPNTRFGINGFDVKNKGLCGGGRGGGRGENELQTYNHPRPGWLNYNGWGILTSQCLHG